MNPDHRADSAPPVIASAAVVAFAAVGGSVRYTDSLHLLVGGTRLGRVPRLAIALDPFDNELFVFHCDAQWNCLGSSGGGKSVAEAKASIERAYPGLHWTETPRTRDEALRVVRDYWRGQECSFCGRVPPQFESSFAKEGGARICNRCRVEFHEAMSTGERAE